MVARIGRILEVAGDGSFAAYYIQMFCFNDLSLKIGKGGMLQVDSRAFDQIEVKEQLLPVDSLVLSTIKHDFDEQLQVHSFYFYD